MTNETYEKLQAELSQLLNTEKYKRMTSKDKDVYKQAVLACKSVVSHYKTNSEAELTCDECCGCDLLPNEDCAYYLESVGGGKWLTR